jgi:predicted PurR-regulated permease PerM
MSQADRLTESLERDNASEHAPDKIDILPASVRVTTIAQIVVAAAAVIGLTYLLKLVLVTILSSILLAYALEPPVSWLAVLAVPRWMGALIVVLLALSLVAGLCYFSYNRAIEFVDQLPRYSDRLRDAWANIRSRVDKVENRARSVIEPPNNQKRPPIRVEVEQPQGLTHVISETGGTILDILMAIGFTPFFVYFMLASADDLHLATVRLFPKERRFLAHRTVGNISAMIRTFIATNVFLGLLNSVIFTLLFWILGIKYFYFIGAISGFVGLIPYLGVFLALLPPLTGGIGTLDKTGIVCVVIAVVGLHWLTTTLLYPKLIGERLKLNPLAVSISLLFWAWIWGAPGLVLAIPLLGCAKIIGAHMQPLLGLGTTGREVECRPL